MLFRVCTLAALATSALAFTVTGFAGEICDGVSTTSFSQASSFVVPADRLGSKCFASDVGAIPAGAVRSVLIGTTQDAAEQGASVWLSTADGTCGALQTATPLSRAPADCSNGYAGTALASCVCYAVGAGFDLKSFAIGGKQVPAYTPIDLTTPTSRLRRHRRADRV